MPAEYGDLPEIALPHVIILNWRDWVQPNAGGAERFVRDISVGLTRLGYRVLLLTERTDSSPDYAFVDGIEIVRLGGSLTRFGRAASRAKALIRKHDSIVIESVNTIPYFTKLFAKKRTITLVHHIAGRELFSEVPFPGSVLLWAVERVIRSWVAPTCVTISNQGAEELSNLGVPRERITIIHPVAGARHESKNPKRLDRQILTYIGPLKRYKGVKDVVSAFQILSGEFKMATLEIAGRGYMASELATQIRRANLGDRVTLHGFVGEQAKLEILQRASVFAYPSMSEGGWSISVLEAMLAGTPIVVTDTLAEMAESGRGAVVSYGKAEQIAAAVRRLWSDPLAYQTTSKRARDWATSVNDKDPGTAMSQLIHRLFFERPP